MTIRGTTPGADHRAPDKARERPRPIRPADQPTDRERGIHNAEKPATHRVVGFSMLHRRIAGKPGNATQYMRWRLVTSRDERRA
jgi:hypothetical protein